MKKLILSFIGFFFTSIVCFAQAEKLRVGVLSGPSCIPVAYMMENTKRLNSIVVNYENFSDPQALLPKMIKKEIDIGFLPVNVAAKVYNSSNKAIICCGVTGNGNISLITTDKNIKRFSDVKGHTVSVAGQGATPDYMFRYLLEQNSVDINQDGITLDYSTPNAQIAAQLISGKTRYAVVPEPFVTVAKSKSKNVTAPLNFQKEYEAVRGKDQTYPLTVMVVRKAFAEENKDVLNEFLKIYESSYKWTVKNPVNAGKLSEKYNLGLTAAVVTQAIPESNYTFVPAQMAKQQIETLLSIFNTYDPASYGGIIPGNDFYYFGE